MTIAEVLKMQKSKMHNGKSVYGSGYNSNATGRYQFMSYVLEEEITITISSIEENNNTSQKKINI